MNVPNNKPNTPQQQQAAAQPVEKTPPTNPLVPGTDEAIRQVALTGYN